MTDEPLLFATRIDDLNRLIDQHLERGSLDEGNATAFDHIIDAWLAEEAARLDGAITDWANREAAARKAIVDARAAADAQAEHRRSMERAATERRQEIVGAHESARRAAADSRRARLDERVRQAAERVAEARSELNTARRLLVGSGTTPVAETMGPESLDQAGSSEG